jgi:DNA-binding NtrC family response regulator
MNERILLAEDDEIIRVTLYDRLVEEGWRVDTAVDGNQALDFLDRNFYRLVISDIRMPGLDGTRLLDEVKRMTADTDVILMTAFGSVESAVTCLKKGAADYVLKPFDMDDLVIRVRRLLEVQSIRARCAQLEESCRELSSPIIGSSKVMQLLLDMVNQVALSDSTVLVTGESGTGKELVASAIHQGSRRSSGPYIRVNCAAMPEGLMESELFGHEKGAFTGAETRKIGRFEMADGGTILLDEIGEIPLHLQAKLLRVLQEREIERVGGSRTIRIDVRILCATSKNLLEEVRKGNFREDLFYRLQVIPIEVPPLRNRKEDIPELCRFFLEGFNRERVVPLSLSDDAVGCLMRYDFPGNIRELRNIIERVSVLSPGPVVQPWDLPVDLEGEASVESEETLRLSEVVAKAEKGCLLKALRETDGNKTEAAKLLCISRKNLWEKLKLYNL